MFAKTNIATPGSINAKEGDLDALEGTSPPPPPPPFLLQEGRITATSTCEIR
jgi:hypothetical protein